MKALSAIRPGDLVYFDSAGRAYGKPFLSKAQVREMLDRNSIREYVRRRWQIETGQVDPYAPVAATSEAARLTQMLRDME